MATPRVSDNPEVQQQYLAQLALGSAVASGVAALWTATTPLASPAAMSKFKSGLYAIVSQFSRAAATLSADYYRNIRREAGVPGTARLSQPQMPPESMVDAGVRWATRERPSLKLFPSLTERIDQLEAEIRRDAQAAMEKAVLDVARKTIVQAVEGDDRAIGYRRVARPDACAFCLMLSFRSTTRKGLATDHADKRGVAIPVRQAKISEPGGDGEKHYGVYKSRATAGQIPGSDDVNRYHDHCHCTVEPVFSPADTIPDWLQGMETLYSDATQGSEKGGALNDFRRALRAHRNGVTPPPPEAPVIALPTKPGPQITALLDAIHASMSNAA